MKRYSDYLIPALLLFGVLLMLATPMPAKSDTLALGEPITFGAPDYDLPLLTLFGMDEIVDIGVEGYYSEGNDWDTYSGGDFDYEVVLLPLWTLNGLYDEFVAEAPVGIEVFFAWENWDQNTAIIEVESIHQVPLPGSAWLFMSAIAGLGLISRKKATGHGHE